MKVHGTASSYVAQGLLVLAVLCLALPAIGCRAALSAPFTPPEAGGASWVEVTSAHFDLHSDLDMGDARSAIEDLERMYATLLDVGFPYEAKPQRRMRVVLFRRDTEYKAVAPFQTRGFFMRGVRLDGDGDEPIAILYSGRDQATQRTLQHELTHRFVAFYYPQAPPWLNEGLAHYYETLQLEGSYAVLGRPQFMFRRGLSWIKGTIPTAAALDLQAIRDMDASAFHSDRGKALTPDDDLHENRRNGACRASAWALVHLLMNGPEEYRAAFATYLRALGQGKTAQDAWNQGFASIDDGKLATDLAASLAPVGRDLTLLRTSYTPPAPQIENAREMPPDEVHLLWSVLARRDARAEVDAALRLAPGSPWAWRAKARQLEKDGALDEAEQALQKAISLRPEDSRPEYELFALYVRRSQTRGAPASSRARAEALVPKLLPRASSFSKMSNGLAWRLGLWGRVDEALPVSQRSLEIDPSCWECYDTLAFLLARKGAFAKAVEAQRLALNLMPEGVSVPEVSKRLREYQSAARAKAKAPEEPVPATETTTPEP